MRVLIITSGSTGDVAPYTGLAVGLRAHGHDVTIATHEPFRAMVTAAGLPFIPIPGDLRQVLPQARGQDGTTSGTDPRALLTLMSLARPLITSLAEGIIKAFAAVRPSAVLLSTLVAPLGYQVAEAHGIPYAGVFPQPLHPTREFGPVLTGGRGLGPWGNLALGHLVAAAARPLYARAIHDLRQELGLPKTSLRTLQAAQQTQHPTFHGFSPAVVPRPADWPAAMRVTGYWWPASPADWHPSPTLTAFLAAGPPPVYFGFGSMAPGQGARLTPMLLAAARQTGHRALLQSGWSGLTTAPYSPDPTPPATSASSPSSPSASHSLAAPTSSPSPSSSPPPSLAPSSPSLLPSPSPSTSSFSGGDVLTIDEVPHDWLFPQMAAVVHHAGAGTTAAGLRAGVPAVAVPVLADQPFWANRLHQLGAAPPPLPMPALSGPRLTAALREATTNPHHSARAQATAARLATEDGTAEINTWLSHL